MLNKIIISLFIFIVGSCELIAFVTPRELTTPSGIKFWFVKTSNTPVISMEFIMGIGNVADPDHKLGLTSISVGMLLQGSGPYNKEDFDDILTEQSIGIVFSQSADYISGSMRTLKANRKKALEMLNLALYQPRLELKNLSRLKSLAITDILDLEKSPGYISEVKLHCNLYPGHPYGKDPTKIRDMIASITIDDVKDFLKDSIGRDHLRVSLVGDISDEEATAIVDEAFAKMPKSRKQRSIPDIIPQCKGRVSKISLPIPQSLILFAQPGLKLEDPDFIKFSVVLYTLGSSQTSRLNEEIREKRGLAYTASAFNMHKEYTGAVYGSLGTKNKTVDEAIKLVKEEFSKIRNQGLTSQELEDAKKYLIGSFPLRFTNSEDIASEMLALQISGWGLEYLTKRKGIIESLTLEDVNKIAAKYINEKVIEFVVVGGNE